MLLKDNGVSGIVGNAKKVRFGVIKIKGGHTKAVLAIHLKKY